MSVNHTIARLERGCAEIINSAQLAAKLKNSAETGRPLKVKAGFDPTAPDIHLGHVVLLRKLRQFQDLGHDVFFLIGDFTAQIGDPTGRDQLRPRMDTLAIQANARTYEEQVYKVLDREKTKVVFNSAWLGALTSQDMIGLTALSTVAQMLARADFKKRYEDGREISLLEFMYPLLQGYDSVHLQADIELGGSDQKFNLLMGRQLQEVYGQPPQVVMMTPLLEGTDGVRKMSKSLDNYIGIDEPPDEIMGKVMSISDELMLRYFEVLTDRDLDEVRALHPKEAKLQLGEAVVGWFHDETAAREARAGFERVFSAGREPDDMAEFPLSGEDSPVLVDILVKAGLVGSKSEARRLLREGAVSFEGERIASEDWIPQPGVLKVGKRRFLRLT